MTTNAGAAQIAPLIDGKYGVRYERRDYTVTARDLGAVLFRGWGGRPETPRFIFDRGMGGEQILRRVGE